MITVRQLKAARALLGWTQLDLATKAGLSRPTIERLEEADGPVDRPIGGQKETADKIVTALERASIEFLNHGEPGVRLRKAKRKR